MADHNVLHSIDPAYVLSDSATCSWTGGPRPSGSGVVFAYVVDVYKVRVRATVVLAGDRLAARENHHPSIRFVRVPDLATWTGYAYIRADQLATVRIIAGHDVISLLDQNSPPMPHRTSDLRLARALTDRL